MTGTPKPPEGISGEGQNNTATAWDTLREYPANIEKAPRKHIDTIMAPERACREIGRASCRERV